MSRMRRTVNGLTRVRSMRATVSLRRFKWRVIGTPDPTSAVWSFKASALLGTSEHSEMLIFTSPYGPTFQPATVLSQSTTEWWQGQVPSPVPEPASLVGLLTSSGILIVLSECCAVRGVKFVYSGLFSALLQEIIGAEAMRPQWQDAFLVLTFVLLGCSVDAARGILDLLTSWSFTTTQAQMALPSRITTLKSASGRSLAGAIERNDE